MPPALDVEQLGDAVELVFGNIAAKKITAKRCAPPAKRPAHHFLQRDDVGIQLQQHISDARGQHAPVESAAFVDVVSGDAENAHSWRSMSQPRYSCARWK